MMVNYSARNFGCLINQPVNALSVSSHLHLSKDAIIADAAAMSFVENAPLSPRCRRNLAISQLL